MPLCLLWRLKYSSLLKSSNAQNVNIYKSECRFCQARRLVPLTSEEWVLYYLWSKYGVKNSRENVQTQRSYPDMISFSMADTEPFRNKAADTRMFVSAITRITFAVKLFLTSSQSSVGNSSCKRRSLKQLHYGLLAHVCLTLDRYVGV